MAIRETINTIMEYLSASITRHGNTGANVSVSQAGVQAFPSAGIFPHGLVSKPIAGAMGIQTSAGTRGTNCILGYFTPFIEDLQDGETILYSTDDERCKTAKVILRKDGKIEVKNANASIIIRDDGEIEAGNGNASIKISADGEIELAGSNETLIIP